MDSVIVLICANLTVTSYICQLTDPFVILQCFRTIELDGQHSKDGVFFHHVNDITGWESNQNPLKHSRQSVSSLKSPQLSIASQTDDLGTHCPLWHLNWLGPRQSHPGHVTRKLTTSTEQGSQEIRERWIARRLYFFFYIYIYFCPG